jgi:20S proteasome subunit alpha 6
LKGYVQNGQAVEAGFDDPGTAEATSDLLPLDVADTSRAADDGESVQQTGPEAEDGKDPSRFSVASNQALAPDVEASTSGGAEHAAVAADHISSINPVLESAGQEENKATNSEQDREAATVHVQDVAAPDANVSSTASEDGVAAIINDLDAGPTDQAEESHDDAAHGDSHTFEASGTSTTASDTQATHTSATLEEDVSTGTKGVHTPSANRLSISYAAGSRRLVIDAEMVDTLKVFRAEGRIEVAITIDREGDGFRGIQVVYALSIHTAWFTRY